MKTKISNIIALVLVGLCFAWSAVRIFSVTFREELSGRTTIRFAHFWLHAPLNKAFDAVIRDYEALHPDVDVVQQLVPRSVWNPWSKTKLIGGNAPEIMASQFVSTQEFSRYFQPLTSWLEEPNPYNRDTNLAEVSWRNTFIGGLRGEGEVTFESQLMEYFGIPSASTTVRVFYNKDLLEKITGQRTPPTTYTEFVEICEAIQRYSADGEDGLVPLAGSDLHSIFFNSLLFAQQSQKLAMRLDYNYDLDFNSEEAALTHLRGRWDLRDPGISDGFRLIQETSQYFQAGFWQMGRDDAVFYFQQQRAVMFLTGPWDAQLLIPTSNFEIGFFRLPFPDKSHPVYGDNVMGPFSEASSNLAGALGVVRGTGSMDIAIDFLQYLTSKPAVEKIASISYSLPALADVEPREAMLPFKPETEGEIAGFNPLFRGFGRGMTGLLMESNLYRLLSQSGDLETFFNAIEVRYSEALEVDLEVHNTEQLRNLRRIESALFARLLQERLPGTPEISAEMADKAAQLHENQNIFINQFHKVRYFLEQ